MEFKTLLFPVHCLTGCLYRYWMCFILLRALIMCVVILSFLTLLPTIVLITVHQGELHVSFSMKGRVGLQIPDLICCGQAWWWDLYTPAGRLGIQASSWETLSQRSQSTVLATLLMYHPLRTKSIPGYPLVFSFYVYCLWNSIVPD